MGHGPDHDLSRGRSLRSLRAGPARDMTAVYAVMTALLLLILLQFLLVMVGIESYLAGERDILQPAAFGSAVCFAAACWLIRYVSGSPTGGPS